MEKTFCHEANYRSIDLSSWVKVGEGGNGSTYEASDQPDIILKLNNSRYNDLKSVKEEFDVSDAVARCEQFFTRCGCGFPVTDRVCRQI